MLARYANLNNFNRVVRTYEFLTSRFGTGEFTAKAFNDAKANSGFSRRFYNSIQYLKDEGIIEVSHTEKTTKEVEVAPWNAETWLIDKNGKALMTEYDWMKLPDVAQSAMLAMNGQDFRMERKDTKTVEKEKYYYVVNPDAMALWRSMYAGLMKIRAGKISDEITKLMIKREHFLAVG